MEGIDRARKFPIPQSIYFGGCSWGAAFQIGVFKALVEIWGLDFHKKTLITGLFVYCALILIKTNSGDSAGSLIALGIAVGKSPEDFDTIYRGLVATSKTIGVIGKMSCHIADAAYQLLVDPDAYKNIEGKLGVAVTHFPCSYIQHWTWSSNAEIMQCVLASCHMPIYCEGLASFKGRLAVDGAYSVSGHDLVHGNDTLFVGFDPHADITAEITQAQMIYPPSTDEEYMKLYHSGYNSMINWNGVMKEKVGKRHPNYIMVWVMWPLRFLQTLWQYVVYILVIIAVLEILEFFRN